MASKGTGRSPSLIRSPQWRGGGAVFDQLHVRIQTPQKFPRLQLKSVYSAKAAEDKF